MKIATRKLPIYILIVILLISVSLHLYFFVKNPGSNFQQPSLPELEQKVEKGEMTEQAAKLQEHTWKYGSRDAYLYAKLANQVLDHGVYGFDTHNTDEIVQNAFVTPGWPMMLIVLFFVADLLHIDQMTIVKLFNMLLNLGTIFLLYLIGTKIFHNRWIGVIAAGLYAAYFPAYHYFRMALTEIPGIFFYCLAIYLFLLALEKKKYLFHFLFAVVFCYGVMIRPVTAPLVLIGFAVLFVNHRSQYKAFVKIAFIWAAGAFIVISPWVIRNYVVLDEFVLFSTHSGNSWYAGSNPFNIYDFSDYWRERESLGMESKEYAFMKIKEGFQNDFGLWLSWFTVGKTYELFKIPDGIYFYSHWALTHIKKAHQLLVIIALLVAFLSRNRRTMAVSAILIGYILLSNLFLTIPRYGFYIFPIVCLLCGYAVMMVVKFGKKLIANM